MNTVKHSMNKDVTHEINIRNVKETRKNQHLEYIGAFVNQQEN